MSAAAWLWVAVGAMALGGLFSALFHSLKDMTRTALDEMAVARSLDGLKLAQLSVGDLDGFRATIAELEAILRRHDDLYFLQYALLEHGTEAAASGQWPESEQLFDEAVRDSHNNGWNGALDKMEKLFA